ncbi:MAG: DNA internalization-related competence protein ComEC/Rec2 [Oscillospiraceae bacterium]|nr:DNA internalization-related competence protein ComEC/Rec2 [Oscillospiraceae bacterium]
MRKLVLFTLGFCAVCALFGYLLWNPWFWAVGAFCLLGAVSLFFVRVKAAGVAAWALVGAAVATAWCCGYNTFYLEGAKAYDGQQLTLTVEASDYSYHTDFNNIFEAKAEFSGIRYPVRVYLETVEDVVPGDLITAEFYCNFTCNADEDFNYLRGSGIVMQLYAQDEAVLTHCEKIPAKYFAVQLQRNILSEISALFPQDTAGFARALLLGDSSLLTYEEDTAFQISGIRHVIAVSGLHVSILFALVYLLCGKHRVLTALLGIPVLILFAFVAGLTPSILRACIMQCIMLLAMLCKREYDPPSALSLSVLIVLLVSPITVTSVSFQLSVGCMVGIFLFGRRLNRHFIRRYKVWRMHGIKGILVKWLCGGVSVTLSAMSLTAPLSTFYFNTISIIGVFTNLAALWIISFVFYGIMLACLGGVVFLPMGKFVAWCVSWGIRYVTGVAKLFAKVPFAAVYTESHYIVMWLVFCYVLFAWLLLSKRKRLFMTAACLLVSLGVAVAASWIEPKLDNVRVSVIDVGQGQAVLLQAGDANFLVDCGGDTPKSAADKVTRTLHAQGVYALDGIFLTHYDKDHSGGIPYLLQRVPADTLYLPEIWEEGSQKQKLQSEFSHIIKMVEGKITLAGDWGSLTAVPGENWEEENENSMCILFQAGNCDILITGDRGRTGESELLQQLDLPKLELLVAGHHGAPGSNNYSLLRKTRPEQVAISLRKDNYYGHPDKGLLLRLSFWNIQVRRTDLEGTVIFRR